MLFLEVINHVLDIIGVPGLFFAGLISGIIIYLCNSWEIYNIRGRKNVAISLAVGLTLVPFIIVIGWASLAMILLVQL